MTELVCYPAFATQPDDGFVSAWLTHINETGYPETYPNVSTTHPPKEGKVVLLSGEIKVPVLRREGQLWVPCPICSPTSPQFKVGRMAYFPEELAVRFIGQNCAAKHFGVEIYAEADERFRVQARCRQYIANWAALLDRREALDSFINEAMPVAEALQFTREQIDNQASTFASFLYTDLARREGNLTIQRNTGLRDQKGQAVIENVLLGTVSYTFLKKGFAPINVLREAKSFLGTMDVPLPNWMPGGEDNDDATLEVLKRGGQATKMMAALREVLDILGAAQDFLSPRKLSLLEDWWRLGGSPFKSLVFRHEGNQILLRAESFEGQYFANALFSGAATRNLDHWRPGVTVLRSPLFDPLTSEKI